MLGRSFPPPRVMPSNRRIPWTDALAVGTLIRHVVLASDDTILQVNRNNLRIVASVLQVQIEAKIIRPNQAVYEWDGKSTMFGKLMA